MDDVLIDKNSWLRLIPFLPSEEIQILDKTYNGNLCLSNFRIILHCKSQRNVISIPINLIRSAETSSSLFHLSIITKIGTTFTCQFKSIDSCEFWLKQFNGLAISSQDFSQMFALHFRHVLESRVKGHPLLFSILKTLDLGESDTTLEAALILHEFDRMGFNHNWKVTDVNSDFKICSSYPKYHIVPRDILDQNIPYMATFRSHNRFPSVVWRSQKTGAVLLRCAQPCVGIMYSRNEIDEKFVGAVLENCRKDLQTKKCTEDQPRLLIVDARNYSVAQLNRLRGGGFEYVEYYDQSQIRFMDLPNLHAVRLSFERLILLYRKPDANWYSALERTMWLSYTSLLLKSASEVATALDVHCRPVMVHCTDGWDRTPQITSLAQILLDPYYRTVNGFRILVEREWLQFGHKFSDRCGHNLQTCSTEEQSPIFLQWLDCVHQIQKQFSNYFEFNELFLIKLAIHTYSGLFGTFLCNSELERQKTNCASQTCSVWAFLNPKYNWPVVNHLYEEKLEVLNPAWHIRNLVLWDSLYVNALLPSNAIQTVNQPPVTTAPFRRSSDTATPLMVSTRSHTDVVSNGLCLSSTQAASYTCHPLISPTAPVNRSHFNVNTPQRSQSLCAINLTHVDQPLTTADTAHKKTIPTQVLRSNSLDRISVAKSHQPPVLPALSVRSHSELNQATDDKLSFGGLFFDKFNTSSNHTFASGNTVQSPTYKNTRLSSHQSSVSHSKGFRLSSIGDNETLVVNTEPIEAVICTTGYKEDVNTAAFSVASEPITHPQTCSTFHVNIQQAFDGGFIPSPTSLPSFSPASLRPHSVSGEACDNTSISIDHYFGSPVFGISFRDLVDESMNCNGEISGTIDPYSSDSNATVGGTSTGDTGDPNDQIDKNRTSVDPENQQYKYTSVQNTKHGNVLLETDFSYPNNSSLDCNINECYSDGELPLSVSDSNHLSMCDGLPLQIDPVTSMLHQRWHLEMSTRIKYQNHIDRLTAEIASLTQELSRCMLTGKSTTTTSATTPTTKTVDNVTPTHMEPLMSNPMTHTTGQDGYGNKWLNHQPSIVETLFDAMNGCGPREEISRVALNGQHNDNGDDLSHIPQLETRSVPLNWADKFKPYTTLRAVNLSQEHNVRSRKASSDISSFDVIERMPLMPYIADADKITHHGCEFSAVSAVPPILCNKTDLNTTQSRLEDPFEQTCGSCNPHQVVPNLHRIARIENTLPRDRASADQATYNVCSHHARQSVDSTSCAEPNSCRGFHSNASCTTSRTCSSHHSQHETAKA